MHWSIAIGLCSSLALAAEPETAQFELSRVLSTTWYETARFDNFFQRGCVATTAIYSKTADGNLAIRNRCLKGSLTGDESSVTGKGWVPDPKAPGKWKVQFFWPFTADMWILELAPDGSWMLMGNPKQSSCWVFSRTPVMEPALYESLVARLKGRGYDTGKLVKTLQPSKP